MSLPVASVWLHERRVGELRQGNDGYIELHPDPGWLEDSERPMAVLRREVDVPDAYRVPLRRHWEAVPVLAPYAAAVV